MKKVIHKAKRAHHSLISLPTLLVILLIIGSGWMSLYALRRNNLGMLEKRVAVERADESGDRVAIEMSLQELQAYSTKHMNASAEVELKHTYDRAAKSLQEETANRLGNIELYQRAEAACLAASPDRSELALCIDDHLSGARGDLVPRPDPRLYRYSFISPYLSLDLASLSLVVFALFFYAGLFQLARFLSQRFIKE